MATRHLNLENHLKSISVLDDYKIEKGDPDPRGWSVVTADGNRVGTVEDLIVDTNMMKVRHMVVDLEGAGGVMADEDRSVLIDAQTAELRHDRREVVAQGTWDGSSRGDDAGASTRGRTTETGRDGETLTRSEEELNIGKREVERGEAVVAKHVETERVSEPVTRRREEVVVERRPVETGARADAAIGDDEVRVPLMEEEVVVEKRPVVKEELVVGKRVVEERDVVETDVRREEFDVDERVGDVSRDQKDRFRNE